MTAGRVLIVGDANVDLVVQGDVIPRFGQAEQLLDRADLVLGGSASIAAAGLARLGVSTHLCAIIGDDEFGRVVRDALADRGVELGALAVDPAVPTGISIHLTTGTDRAMLTHPGTIPLLSALDVRRAVESVAPTHVHFASFFLLPQLSADLPELLGWLRAQGITTSLDTNWDPADRWSGLTDVVPVVDVLLPNRDELVRIAASVGATFDSGVDSEIEAARAIAALGPRVVVKTGSEGCWSIDSAGAVSRAAGLDVAVIDASGAGDSFDAGYLAAIIRGVAHETERLRWAAVAGSLSTLGRGGTAGQATLAELRERL